MPFTAAREAVIVRLRQIRELLHVEQRMRDAAEPFDDAPIEVGVQPLPNLEEQPLLAELELGHGALAQLPPLRPRHVEPLAILVMRLGLP